MSRSDIVHMFSYMVCDNEIEMVFIWDQWEMLWYGMTIVFGRPTIACIPYVTNDYGELIPVPVKKSS